MLGDLGAALGLLSVSSAVHQLSCHCRALGTLLGAPQLDLYLNKICVQV